MEGLVQPSQVVVCLNQLRNSESRELGTINIVIVDPLVAQGYNLDNRLSAPGNCQLFVIPQSQYFHPHDHSQAIVPDTRSPD